MSRMVAGGAYPRIRPRRLRDSAGIRAMVQENWLRPCDLIQPLFVHAGSVNDPIASMPGQDRIGFPNLCKAVERVSRAGVPAIALFPKVDDSLKSVEAAEAWNPEGLIPNAIKEIKSSFPDILVITDVALDPYSSAGQDGVVTPSGEVDNEATIEALIKQAECQAEAGADMVAPSDMMDGRVARIREFLDAKGHYRTKILAYSAKYASAFYGPFRDALDSAPTKGTDKKTYQMNPANGDEALQEVALDLGEGADIVMVKPGMPYLDVVYRIKEHFKVPVAVYQVSGEYAMLKAAAQNGWLDEKQVVLESLMGFKRAGADLILTYYATTAAEWLKEEGV
eukprot:Sspe_Gene.52545::Locus_29102_Transcript_1_1_Confidence_1.000_Length_1379::g.52545::m.52545/K01698/hemB, ALAD; porphobilinogen synthase